MSDQGDADMPPPAASAEEEAAQPAVPLAEAPAAAGAPAKKGAGVKRKVAMFLAYNGHGYQGMQRNPGAKTIEDELFRAIYAAGGISDANSGEDGFAKIHWMRAARTDKGVSAVGQVVSLKMVVEPEGMVERINAALPGQIRVLGFTRTTNGFDSRRMCDKRRYEYILPEWAFDPEAAFPRGQQSAAALGALREAAAAHAAGASGQQAADPSEAGAAEEEEGVAAPGASGAVGGAGPEPAEAKAEAEAGGGRAAAGGAAEAGPSPSQPAAAPFVFDAAAEQRLSEVLSQYEGTHNFHNFTVRTPASAPNAKRFILSFRCAGVMEVAGERWVRMVVVGQSFMLHQIRKLVGLAVAVMRGTAPPGAIKTALRTNADLNVPMAPELGLFLDEAYFGAYNRQWGHQHAGILLGDYQGQVDEFKATQLYPHIVARDREEGVNAAWLRSLTESCYRFGDWTAMVARVQVGGGRRPAPSGGAVGGGEGREAKRQKWGGNQGKHARRGGEGAQGGAPAEAGQAAAQGGKQGTAAGAAAAPGAAAVVPSLHSVDAMMEAEYSE